jgi:hypothetical protein
MDALLIEMDLISILSAANLFFDGHLPNRSSAVPRFQ